MVNGLMGWGLALLRPADILLHFIFKKFLAKTDREKRLLNFPKPFAYLTTASIVIIYTICILYSTLFPLITVFALTYFALGHLIIRYNILYVLKPVYETRGLLFRDFTWFILVAIVFFQTTMFAVFLIFKFYEGAAILPLIAFSFYYAYLLETLYKKRADSAGADMLLEKGDDYLISTTKDKEKDKEMMEIEPKFKGDIDTDPKITSMGLIQEVELVQRVSPSPILPPPKNPNPYVQREQLPVTTDDIAPLLKDKSTPAFSEPLAQEP